MIDGALLEEGRKLLTETNYTIEATKTGWATYELAVDRTGKVTSARLIDSNLTSTPSKMMVRDHLMKYTFQPGTYYPKFHHVQIRISTTKKAI